MPPPSVASVPPSAQGQFSFPSTVRPPRISQALDIVCPSPLAKTHFPTNARTVGVGGREGSWNSLKSKEMSLKSFFNLALFTYKAALAS